MNNNIKTRNTLTIDGNKYLALTVDFGRGEQVEVYSIGSDNFTETFLGYARGGKQGKKLPSRIAEFVRIAVYAQECRAWA